MADEITVRTYLKYDNGTNRPVIWAEEELTHDITGNAVFQGVQNIGTSAEALDLGDIAIANVGWCVMKNLDSTNFVRIGDNTPAYLLRLNAGETCVFRFDQSIVTGIKLIADTAAVDVQYLLIET
jgi:hypothetical protein